MYRVADVLQVAWNTKQNNQMRKIIHNISKNRRNTTKWASPIFLSNWTSYEGYSNKWNNQSMEMKPNKLKNRTDTTIWMFQKFLNSLSLNEGYNNTINNVLQIPWHTNLKKEQTPLNECFQFFWTIYLHMDDIAIQNV
jgi:hypothetical protein